MPDKDINIIFFKYQLISNLKYLFIKIKSIFVVKR